MSYQRIGRASDLFSIRERRLYRFFEILPGALAWATLVLIVTLSFLAPVWMAIFIILFDVYWLIKTVYLSLHMRAAFSQMRENLKTDWQTKLQQLSPAHYQLPTVKSWQDIYHVVILPVFREGAEVISMSIESLAISTYPKTKMVVVLAQEERAGAEADQISTAVYKEFQDRFFHFVVVKHPADLPGEMAGKGANATYALRYVKEKIIDQLHLNYDHVLVSNFDIDTVVPPGYFSLLSYRYLTTPHPTRASYQPIPLYTNNIWEAPAFARVFAFSTTFWQMIQQSRPEQLVTFSSQSMSLRALVEVGYWQTNVVSEDSRIFWQCLLRYDGDWRTVPIHYPVYMDANVAPTFWQTIKNQYKQIRRWHFGVENNPYFMFGFVKNKKIPVKKKWRLGFSLNEKTHSAATSALIIFLLGWLPVLAGGAKFNQTVLSLNLPQLTRTMMSLAMLGLVSSAMVSVLLLPPKPPQYGRFKWVWMVLQWLLFPLNFIFFGALPAIDAQTRLMLGKYLGFWATPKSRATKQVIQNAGFSGTGPVEL